MKWVTNNRAVMEIIPFDERSTSMNIKESEFGDIPAERVNWYVQ